MTTSPKPPKRQQDTELRPDGWKRFEQAVDAAAKSGPMHRTAKPAKREKKPATR